jgi:endonuclease YncB( thermonuclease family)
VRYDLALLVVLGLTQCGVPRDVMTSKFITQEIKVLDGDTVIFEGKHIRVLGIDAPELGPWAKCWAEAALAGHSKQVLEDMLVNNPEAGAWKLTNVSDVNTKKLTRANLVREDGEDVADSMVVYGSAAKTTGKWDWCGNNANLHSVEEGEPEPYGPNLWWPTGPMFDERAAD